MLNGRQRTVLAGALLASAAAHAACESELAERMHVRLYAERQLEAPLAACRAWSAHPGRSIVVLPLRKLDGPPGQRVMDLAVLVVQRPDNGNSERDTVIGHLYQPEGLRESGPALQELRIDTARYLLAPEVRAFGLRARYRSDSVAAPFAGETLRLYLHDGARKGQRQGQPDPPLREVLAETEIERESGRWDLQCAGRFERLRTRVTLEPVAGQRWADLLLARTLTPRQTQYQADGQCASREGAPRRTPLRLRFDGQRYPVEAALQSAR